MIDERMTRERPQPCCSPVGAGDVGRSSLRGVAAKDPGRRPDGRLEFGQVDDVGIISAKIFLALPDEEQSFAAGIFKANLPDELWKRKFGGISFDQ